MVALIKKIKKDTSFIPMQVDVILQMTENKLSINEEFLKEYSKLKFWETLSEK